MTTAAPTTELTAKVLASFDGAPDPRTKAILEAVTRHLHALVEEVRPTITEWESAIDFLTRTGTMCSAHRQEFILLSDVLGVSMMVETINGAELPDATDSTVLGPFHTVASPPRRLGDHISAESAGDVCVVHGSVVSVDGDPIPGARIDVWQANTEGFYDVQEPGIQSIGNGRGLLVADDQGRFYFRTVVPRFYPIPTDGPVGELLHAAHRHPFRPAHIHFLVQAPGFADLTTHIFVADSRYLDSDAVFAVQPALVKEFLPSGGTPAPEWRVDPPFVDAGFDIVLARAEPQPARTDG